MRMTTKDGHPHNNKDNDRSNITSNPPPPLFTSLISGACAGAVAKTVVAPFDRTKIYFQVSRTEFSYRNALSILRQGYKKHGIANWWRGNSATMARIIPYAAINFASHDRIKAYFLTTDQNFLPKGKRFVAGSLAGMTACTCTYPLDMVRARMAVAGRKKYANLRATFVSIYKQEGVVSFWNGFTPTLLGIIPYAGTSFFVYESSKKYYYDLYPEHELTIQYRLLFGAVAGLCGQSISYPLDVVRRRMQTDGLDGKGYKYRNLTRTLQSIRLQEGVVKGLYKGLSINFIKGPIAVGVSFATKDAVHMLLDSSSR